MYKVIFKYKSGAVGVCAEHGNEIVFKTKKEADCFAKELNDSVSDNLKDFFPVWSSAEC